MKGKLFAFPLLLTFFFVSVISYAAPVFSQSNDSDSGVVVAIYDGDTVRVKFSDGSSRRVRLIGVDAPEMDDARENVALWSHLAKRFSFYCLYGKNVRLTYDQTRLDQYGRTLAYVWTDKEKLFNDIIIREGFAYAFLAFPFRSDFQKRFKEAQQEARQGMRGLWRKDDPDVISSAEARSHLGKYISVKFSCSSVEEKRSFVYFSSLQQEFEALIPRDRQALFPAGKTFLGKSLIVSGFLEEFKGRPQIIVFFPRQLRLAVD